ncbi:MFS transporter [Paenibacillus sp. SYP-B3998]|uniref:MFS transporter n=1 Tax=Paenibacillus sp. SYP-B3998 TaxID=2678564 RepID=A0A6G4A0M0_9BACL|nr:MFS transporter [Paenibacillus sp. SYP-B3998]NEW07890.1 MFS transporter [Paenibacillus sp. SYP-B3998]
MSDPTSYRPYTNRNIFIFSGTRLISELGSALFKFALSLYILDLTGSAVIFSIILGLSILPGVFVNIFAGVYVDRSNKKKVLVFSELLSGIIMFSLLLLFYFEPAPIWLLGVYSVILNVIQSFTLLALNASIPNLVDQDRVHSLNSSYQSIGAVINVVGPMVGALAYQVWGFENILIFSTVFFILAGSLQWLLRFHTTSDHPVAASYFESLKEVFRYIEQQAAIKYVLFLFVVINFILAPLMQVVLPYVTYRELHISAQQLSIIQASWFVGIIIGAILVSQKRVHHFMINKIFILFQIQAILFACWCFPKLVPQVSGSPWAITGFFFVLLMITGLMNSMGNIPMISYIQVYTPDHLRASVFGVTSSITMLATPLGIWVYGFVLNRIDWAYLPLVSGGIVFVVGLLAHQNRQLREFFKKNDAPLTVKTEQSERISAS